MLPSVQPHVTFLTRCSCACWLLPTAGLDAFAALSVMAHLAAMARGLGEGSRPCAVLVTIHQPRAAIWDMLDKVIDAALPEVLNALLRGCLLWEVGGLMPAWGFVYIIICFV